MAKIPSSKAPFLNKDGTVSREWYTYLSERERTADAVAAGEVVVGSGLAGGGLITDGVTIQIEDNGVSDTMLRQSNACSVIGRMFDSAGNVTDIQATGDNRALTRESGLLAFRDVLKVRTIELTDAAVASVATPSTHKFAITLNGANYFILLTT